MAIILVADDDLSIQEMLTVALEAEGHRVTCVSDGQEAYHACLTNRPDLVFLDVMMPVHNGYEVCEMIRNQAGFGADLPVILLSAVDYDPAMMERVGASDYVSKQHAISSLPDVLYKHLGPDAVGNR